MKEKYIERVKRLLALASSTTFPLEAERARRKAHQLMMKYHILSEDLILPHYTPPPPTPPPGPIYEPEVTVTSNSEGNVWFGGWNITWSTS